jgi:hypothetical protein
MRKQIIVTFEDHINEKFQPIDIDNIKNEFENYLLEDYDVTVISVEVKENLDASEDTKP